MAIEIKNLTYNYPNSHKALDNICLHIKKKRKTAILGKNGSGKSTLLYHINGMNLPEEGSVKVLDVEVNKKNLKSIQRNVGYIFDYPDYQLFSTSAYKDIEFGLDNYGYSQAEKTRIIQRMSKKLDVEDLMDRPSFHLSLGQKKKIALAGILVLEPEVLLCDEPFSGLDTSSLDFFKDLLDQWKDEGKTIVFSTHDVDLTYEWADDVIILREGKVIKQGTVEEVFLDEEIYKNTDLQKPYLYRLFKDHEVLPRSIDEAVEIQKNMKIVEDWK
ncbi:MAG: energy-coupling factor ABC transporter ATP-binding protein [Senegalia sp. (in: firmicutes)]|uniref:energy-coupling factor ABC transporter ATP-binding protein n=1 Tax=Senegalia sp. (in: firmicutes) TaxID=1924098 RepID=UPI003F9DA7D9